jgi:predicted metal-binding membrane protein
MSNTTFDVNGDHRPDRVSLSLREAGPVWIALLAMTALAWIVTLDQVRAMGNGAGTMGMSLVAFVAMWTAMMAAMMFPSMAPVAILWTRSILRRRSSAVAFYRIVLFASGYLLAWAAAGVMAYFGLALFEQVLVFAGSGAGLLGAGIFVTAGIYQLTPFKDVCLKRCRSPMSLLTHYTSFSGLAVDLRVGIHHGLYCIACCWGLMLILVAVGVMNIPAMVALTVVIFAEKILPQGLLIARLTGICFFGAAIAALIWPSAFPGLLR